MLRNVLKYESQLLLFYEYSNKPRVMQTSNPNLIDNHIVMAGIKIIILIAGIRRD